jgi:pimeloyl-ACP methyl ester carboxylesterase
MNYGATGPYTVQVWNGAVPGTEGNARVFYPQAPAGTRVPLVVFAHGFQLNVANFDVLLRHVAAWGYVVASVDYPGTILGTDHREVAAAIRSARGAFAMGRVSGFPGAAAVDAGRAVAMGHSLGGKAAIMAVLEDSGFMAGVALDPVDDNPSPGGRVDDAHPSVAPERMSGLRVPLALFGASQSRCGILGQSCAPEASNWQAFQRAAPMGATVATYPLLNYGHNDFVDTSCGLPCLACARGAEPRTTRDLALRGLTVGFLERYTKNVLVAQAYVDGALRAALVANGTLWDGTSPLPACR